MEVAHRRSRSTSSGPSLSPRRLVVQNTFLEVVDRKGAHSATPPRRRAFSAGATEFPSRDPEERARHAARCQARRATTPAREASRPPSGGGPAAGSRPAAAREDELTTVVIRGMPQVITRDSFLELLGAQGFEKQYDFVYLPTDFGMQCCFGYAFINLVSPKAAQRFHEVFAGFSEWSVPWDFEAEVGWAALQGLDRHVEKYRNSPVMHHSVGDESRPILLKDGVRIDFPLPTKKIGLVKRLRSRRNPPASVKDSEQIHAVLLERPRSQDQLLSWDYQDTDEELQPTKPRSRRAATQKATLLLAPGLEPLPSKLKGGEPSRLKGGDLLKAGLEPVAGKQTARPKQPAAGAACLADMKRRSLPGPPGRFEGSPSCLSGPPGCFARRPASDLDALSDCSSRAPTCRSALGGSAVGSARSLAPPPGCFERRPVGPDFDTMSVASASSARSGPRRSIGGPPGCFTRKTPSEADTHSECSTSVAACKGAVRASDALSDCSTQVPGGSRAFASAGGRRGAPRQPRSPQKQRLAASFSLLANGLVRDPAGPSRPPPADPADAVPKKASMQVVSG